ncbi:MAG: NUDIX hydrolase [Gammaproteobacteria bacterium]|nr:NUDIX hydrolase [Gammaproteobacteria bacterium]
MKKSRENEMAGDRMMKRGKRPFVMVDIVIFTVTDDILKVLLVKRGIHPFKDQWALPGGAVQTETDKTLEDAAMRELVEETGLKNNYLEQLYSFGDADRDPRGWTVSVAYFALVAADEVTLKAGTDAAEAQWHAVKNNKIDLAFDHRKILEQAVERLRSKQDYTAIAVHLLPREFTLGEFQRVYEIIMEEKLNKSSFRKRVMKAEIVKPVKGKMRIGPNRPAQLYRFVKRKGNKTFFPRSLVWAERVLNR